MPFKITNDLIKNRRDLARVLGTREVLPLVFGDEPDKYWNALPTGDISVTEMVMLGTGTIEWIVPDGVAHAINPRVFSNTDLSVTASNQVLDPEFKNKDKYYKPWTTLTDNTFVSSNVLRADFTDVDTIADKGNYTYKGFHIVQKETLGIRHFPDMKKGDALAASVYLKSNTDTDITKNSILVVQELRTSGGGVVYSHDTMVKGSTSGGFTQYKVYPVITSNETKYIRLLVGVAEGESIDISKPQYNIGSSLQGYVATKATYSDYMAVTNSGSFRAWPIIRAVMNGDNGLVGLINQNTGLLQFGNAEDVDTIQGVKTDKVINIPMQKKDQSQFILNSPNVKAQYPYFLENAATPNITNGSMVWGKYSDAVVPSFVDTGKAVWNGPSLYKTIPSNSSNSRQGDFTWRNRFDYTPTPKGKGRVTFGLQTSTKHIIGCCLRDSSSNKDEMVIEFSYLDKVIKTVSLDRTKWTGTFWEFYIQRKNGSNIEFRFSHVTDIYTDDTKADLNYIYNINIPEMATTNIEAMHAIFNKYEKITADFMSWADTKFYWNNETEVTNVPNLFDDGDVLELDIKNRLVKLNGVENNYLHALGNQWEHFAIEPGTTTMLPVCSSWANMFQLDVELREAYL